MNYRSWSPGLFVVILRPGVVLSGLEKLVLLMHVGTYAACLVWTQRIAGGTTSPQFVSSNSARPGRSELVSDLTVFVDLVVLELETGTGTAHALEKIAGLGNSWFRRLMEDCDSRRCAMSTLGGLRDLAVEIGMTELAELSDTLRLADESGSTQDGQYVAVPGFNILTVDGDARDAGRRRAAMQADLRFKVATDRVFGTMSGLPQTHPATADRLDDMTELSDLEARLASLEARMVVVAADAEAARHLAAARDRDLADLGIKVDANRAVINALGEQLTGRVGKVEARVAQGFETMEHSFAEIRGRFDGTAAGQQVIVDLLNRLLEEPTGD